MTEYNREKRASHRFQVLGHAQLKVGPLTINCVIRDVSQSGAKLGVPRSARLPKSDLWLVQGDAKMRVVLKWREGDYIGVEFVKKGMAPAADKQVVLDA